ncbi:hypothetical protein JTB14_030852 [Gonioctena quinquepunctata]|nr:hypothetical protein JTB14_030852 [Gonioctena quinquepunctata]
MYCTTNIIFQKFIALNYPATNGFARRNIQTLRNQLAAVYNDKKSIQRRAKNMFSASGILRFLEVNDGRAAVETTICLMFEMQGIQDQARSSDNRPVTHGCASYKKNYGSHIMCKNGRNLKGASEKLVKALAALNKSTLNDAMISGGISSNSIHSAPPHIGGAWERLFGAVEKPIGVAFIINH